MDILGFIIYLSRTLFYLGGFLYLKKYFKICVFLLSVLGQFCIYFLVFFFNFLCFAYFERKRCLCLCMCMHLFVVICMCVNDGCWLGIVFCVFCVWGGRGFMTILFNSLAFIQFIKTFFSYSFLSFTPESLIFLYSFSCAYFYIEHFFYSKSSQTHTFSFASTLKEIIGFSVAALAFPLTTISGTLSQ